LNIYAGVYDGLENNGPIPITQSINFYITLHKDLKVADSSKYISDSEDHMVLRGLGSLVLLPGKKRLPIVIYIYL